MPGFFDQPVNQYQPNPEPPETTLLRDLLARKSFDLQADPYGGNQMRSNKLNDAPAFGGGGDFYGPMGSGGSGEGPGSGPNVGPRQSPLRALMQRLTQTLHPRPTAPGAPMSDLQDGPRQSPTPSGSNLGSFFRAMQRFAPARDSRGPLRQLIALSRAMQQQPAGEYDGANGDTGQLPGYDARQIGPLANNQAPQPPQPDESGYMSNVHSNPLPQTRPKASFTQIGGRRGNYSQAPAWTGGWQYDQSGMPIGPGGVRYTGAGHEFSGGMGGSPQSEAFRRQAQAGQAAGGPSYNQWLQEIRNQQVARSNAAMTPDQIAQYEAAREARLARWNSPEWQAREAQGRRLSSGGGMMPPSGPAVIGNNQ